LFNYNERVKYIYINFNFNFKMQPLKKFMILEQEQVSNDSGGNNTRKSRDNSKWTTSKTATTTKYKKISHKPTIPIKKQKAKKIIKNYFIIIREIQKAQSWYEPPKTKTLSPKPQES